MEIILTLPQFKKFISTAEKMFFVIPDGANGTLITENFYGMFFKYVLTSKSELEEIVQYFADQEGPRVKLMFQDVFELSITGDYNKNKRDT